jgi:hypothetical protein
MTAATELSPTQVLALAPDPASAKAGRGLAAAPAWATLGRADGAAWGECKGSAKLPYQAAVDLSEPAFRCSCPSRKFPCKHGLGLLLLLVEQPQALPEAPAPTWVGDWLADRARRAATRVERSTSPSTQPADPAAQVRRAQRRESSVADGLAEVERWLDDLVRHGLGAAQQQPPSFWERPAARMVDAQAPGVARLLREMASAAHSGDGWPARLLDRLGRLHLLLEAHKRLDALPPATRDDVRALVGWTQSQDTLLAEPGQRGSWAVVGQRVDDDGRLRTQRSWLLDERGRAALVLAFAHGAAPLEAGLIPGTRLDAELVYFPGSVPLRALVKARHGPPAPLDGLAGHASAAAALDAYAAALAANPWLEEFPLALADVVPVRDGNLWLARDAAGDALPLHPRFDGGWSLLALAGGGPVGLFGEWDGQQLLPLGAVVEGRFHAL